MKQKNHLFGSFLFSSFFKKKISKIHDEYEKSSDKWWAF